MSFKMPHTSPYLRQLISGKPLVNTIQSSKMSTRSAAWNRFTVSQRCSLRSMEVQQPRVYPINCRWIHPAPAQRETSPAREEEPKAGLPDGFQMSEAEIFEREIDPTDTDTWTQGADGFWLHRVTEPGEPGKDAKTEISGPYVKTEEGFVHMERYYPNV